MQSIISLGFKELPSNKFQKSHPLSAAVITVSFKPIGKTCNKTFLIYLLNIDHIKLDQSFSVSNQKRKKLYSYEPEDEVESHKHKHILNNPILQSTTYNEYYQVHSYFKTKLRTWTGHGNNGARQRRSNYQTTTKMYNSVP